MPRPEVGTRRVILCYHSIHPSVHYSSATPDEFDEQLDWLAATCDVVALEDLVARPNLSGTPQVALTFDDGYADNHTYAFPRLAAHGMTATFFLTAGFLERDADVLGHLTRIWETPLADLSPLAWSQVAEMQDTGMTFGSHSWSHANLAPLPPAVAEQDMRRAKDVIEARLRAPVDAIAYPFGKLHHNVSPETFRLAAAAGYTSGYVSLPRAINERDAPLRIPRFGVGNESIASLGAKVRGDIDWHATVHRHLPRRVSAALFRQYP
jgi:peptidoglycan/xylan/chitin deacetylase (PgdA/CDA1 family)